MKTYRLADLFWIDRMAACIYDAVIGRRMESGMPIGHSWSPIEPYAGRVSAWLSILGSQMSKAGYHERSVAVSWG